MIFIIFVVATLLELYVIIQVGSIIGAFSTIILIILTAFFGSFLLKQQGLQTLKKAQQTANQGSIPAFALLEGVVLLISGVMLLTPGFITDILGLLGLLPFTRPFIIHYILEKNSHRIFKTSPTKTQTKSNEVIDAEFWENK